MQAHIMLGFALDDSWSKSKLGVSAPACDGTGATVTWLVSSLAVLTLSLGVASARGCAWPKLAYSAGSCVMGHPIGGNELGRGWPKEVSLDLILRPLVSQ